jgi:predicted PurR-regulated permease PerM
LSFGQGTFGFLISAGLMLYLLFFFFRDGRDLVGAFRRVVPLSEENTRKFSVKFTSVVRATVRGTLVIALVQAIIGGLTFRLLGLEPALLWAVVMFFVSLIPILGTSLVWVPAAIYLGLTGHWLKAVALVAVGLLVIGLVDNVLRPRLVGMETRMPDYVVLLSTLGGLSVLGANGFVIGPLIAALFISAWDIFTEDAQAKTPKL